MITEQFSVRRLEMPGIIPPLLPEIGMSAMISGEFQDAALTGFLKNGRGGAINAQREEEEKKT